MVRKKADSRRLRVEGLGIGDLGAEDETPPAKNICLGLGLRICNVSRETYVSLCGGFPK